MDDYTCHVYKEYWLIFVCISTLNNYKMDIYNCVYVNSYLDDENDKSLNKINILIIK